MTGGLYTILFWNLLTPVAYTLIIIYTSIHLYIYTCNRSSS